MPHFEHTFRTEIHQFKPYGVANSQGMIKLDAMENPFPLPEEIQIALADKLKSIPIHRYPDATLKQVKSGIRALMAPPEGTEIVVGNGSDEILQLLVTATAQPNAIVMGIEPSFAMYKILCQYLNTNYVGIPLNGDFSLNLPAILAAIKTRQPNLFFLAHPNNPTGNCFDREAIEAIIQAVPGLVVIDEAYYAFTSHSFLSDILKYPNAIIVRTVSKLGMAGLRLGCAIGHPKWMAPLELLRLPYNINSLTQAAFEVLVEHKSLFAEQTGRICFERERLYQALSTMRGVQHVWHSECNFLLFKVTDALHVHAELKNKGILIKQLHGTHPLLEHVLRVSIGSEAENTQFLAHLYAILSVIS